jgi:hypothetical protein
MEILGSRIPGFQSAIASGLESVTAGIAETTKAAGVAALSVAQDSFSSEQLGTTSAMNLLAVTEAAEYSAPDQYFRKFPGTASDSPVSSLAIKETLGDRNFDVPKALHTFREGSATVVDDVMNYVKAMEELRNIPTQGEYWRETHDTPKDRYGTRLDNKAIGPSLITDVSYDAANRNGRDKSDVASLVGGGYPSTDRFGRENSEVPSVGEALMYKPAPGTALTDKLAPDTALMYKPGPGTALTDKLTPSAEQRFGRNKVEGTSAESVSGAENALQTLSNKTGLFDDVGAAVSRSFALTEEATFRDAMEIQEKKQRDDIAAKQDAMIAASAKREAIDSLSYSATERFGRDQRNGSSVETAAVAGSSDAASSRSIIVVGGKSDASDRSIIVVGGKTPDTYLQTIDDSLNQLRENPTAQTADLFRHQFGAVQNLLSTVDQVVNLQQNFTSNLFERNIRG